MKYFNKGGYSEETRKLVVPDEATIYIISTKLTPVMKWVNNKPSDEVRGYKVYLTSPSVQNGEPFAVKLSKKVSLPTYLSKVTLVDFEACMVGNNIFFKASDIKEGK
ncbi:hypothetical protein [Lactobacillus helveticus]|uniref:hypothetical protein n=1 Tax=Lactobacillus helveticus TaxID=1587 RepID=UPI0015627EE1|nr:hypothetical protein [Lactobacillus helveticus]NRO26079.1 hypothetical protein [Lactobacillus helveticus]NRO31028.1 hypothetical protein [Lactobacillus helveticus]